MGYNENIGLSKYEFELEKIVDEIKKEPSTILSIWILKKALSLLGGGSDPITIIQDQNTEELIKELSGFHHFVREDTILIGDNDYFVCGCTYLADENRLLVQCEKQ